MASVRNACVSQHLVTDTVHAQALGLCACTLSAHVHSVVSGNLFFVFLYSSVVSAVCLYVPFYYFSRLSIFLKKA